MYTHIAFDVDGTIIDTVQAFTVSLSQTIQALKGEYISPKDLEHFFGVTSKGTVEGVGFEDEEAALSMWEENYVRVYNDTSVPFEGIEDILRTLKQRDKVMGLVTSRCRMEINRDPNLARWNSYLSVSISSDDTRLPKPNADPALAFAEKLGVRPESCLYIGDSVYDALCARNAGMDFALADWRGTAQPDIPAKYHLRRLEEILEVVG